MIDFEKANIIKAPGCPHYMPRDAYDTLFLALDGAVASIKCERCYEKPVLVFGQFEKSGPVSNRPRTTKDPAGKGYLKRRAA